MGGVTIKDVAARARVSPATVSLVLNSKPGIGRETRAAVLAAAQALGYKQIRLRRQGQRTGTIRFLRIAKHGHIINENHNHFIADYIDGLEQEAKIQGFGLEVSIYNHFNAEEILASVRNSVLDGAVILGTELDESDVEALQDIELPVVFIDTYHSYSPFDFIDMNNDASVYSVVSHFLENGHRNIGLVKATFETRNFRLRERSFYAALNYFKLPDARGKVFAVDSTYQKAYEEMLRLLEKGAEPPRALFCVCDIIAYGCMRAFKEQGYRVPQDISLVGFDDLPSSAIMDPPLTSVKVSKQRIGRRAMQLLIRRLKDGGALPYEKVLIGGELVIRKSVLKLI